MEINIESHGSYLRLTPIVPELLEVLTFHHRSQKYELREYGEGEDKKTVRVRAGFTSTDEMLYTIAEDGLAMGTYRGLLTKVCTTLRKIGHTWRYQRLGQQFVQPEISAAVFEGLRSEQLDFVMKFICAAAWRDPSNPLDFPPNDGGCLGEGATGVGKTHIIAALIRAFWKSARKILVITDSQSVVRSLFHELSMLFKDEEIRVGISQGVNVAIQKVTISTVKMLHLHEPLDVDVAIYDEVHGAAANEAAQALLSFPYALRFGLSGTVTGRSDGKELFLESIFGPIVATITDQEAEAKGRVSRQNVYVMSVPRGPIIPKEWEADDIRIEKYGIWHNIDRNETIGAICRAAPEDQQLLVFVRTVEHLEVLINRYLPEGFEVMHGELKAADRKRIERAFVNGEIKRMIATDCIKQGLNTKNLFLMVNANWQSSRVGVMQRRGRNRRTHEDKEFGVIFDFADEWMTAEYQRELKRLEVNSPLPGFTADADVQEEKFRDIPKAKAEGRLRHYRKAGDTIIRVSSLAEIKFNPSPTSISAEIK